MRARTFFVSLLVIASAATVSVSSAASAATGTLTVTPSTGLSNSDVVEIVGTGFPPSVTLGVCEGIVAAGAGHRRLRVHDRPGLDRRERRLLDLVRSPPLPDRRRSTGRLRGTRRRVCHRCGRPQRHPGHRGGGSHRLRACEWHPPPDLIFQRHGRGAPLRQPVLLAPWLRAAANACDRCGAAPGPMSFACRTTATSPTTSCSPRRTSPCRPFGLRVFLSYYDVTSLVTGSGLVFPNVAAGAVVLGRATVQRRCRCRRRGHLGSLKLELGLGAGARGLRGLWVAAPRTDRPDREHPRRRRNQWRPGVVFRLRRRRLWGRDGGQSSGDGTWTRTGPTSCGTSTDRDGPSTCRIRAGRALRRPRTAAAPTPPPAAQNPTPIPAPTPTTPTPRDRLRGGRARLRARPRTPASPRRRARRPPSRPRWLRSRASRRARDGSRTHELLGAGADRGVRRCGTARSSGRSSPG